MADMTGKTYQILSKLALMALIFVIAAGCQVKTVTPDATTVETVSNTIAVEPSATPTVTPTPEPAALIINGQPVPLADFQAGLLQLQVAESGASVSHSADEQKKMVLESLVEETLLAEAAYQGGFTMDDAALQTRYDQLANRAGGQEALNAWILANGYTESSFRSSLRRAVAAAWQRDQILADVSKTAEQIKAIQILVQNRSTADQLYSQLQAGADFATLALQYDPLTGGDLGWFPQGYLTQRGVEEAVFALQPGEYTGVIESELGFHLVFVVERDPEHALSPDALLTIQKQALQNWLESRKADSQIEILVP